MSTFETASVVEAYESNGQDRFAICNQPDSLVIVVADGAGGFRGGGVAADHVVREVRSAASQAASPDDWVARLKQIDHGIGDGESTGVVVCITRGGLCGASVGDSQAWIVRDGQIDVLTASQVRKPLLGSGQSMPVGFSRGPLEGLLIVATDGFFNYVKRDRLLTTLASLEFVELPRGLLDLVRLRTGGLQDDVAIVVCRRRPQRGSRVVYDIPLDLS